MIHNVKELSQYLRQDAAASARKSIFPKLLGDEIWKFQLSLRCLELLSNQKGWKCRLLTPVRWMVKWKYHRLSVKLNFTIPINAIEAGLSLPHYGTIVIAKSAKIGCNCRIHEGVTIGATNGSAESATIGDNVFLASGAKIIGAVSIANRVSIGANAVVVHSILEEGTTWAGIPAKKISDKDSQCNLNPQLFR